MKRIPILCSALTIAAMCTTPVYAANECRAKYGYGQNNTRTVNINAGQTKTINKNNVTWVQNKKSREIKVRVTKMVPKLPFGFKASGTKWVTLSNAGNIDPPLAPLTPYPSGVKLYKIKCKANSSSGGTTGGSSGSINLGNLATIPLNPQIRSLQPQELAIAKAVYGKSINFSLVKVTNTVGLQKRPWTTNTPPIYTMNVGISGF